MSVLWSEAQILNVLGIDDQAIPALRRVRDFFIRLNCGYEVCRISIELALNYVAQRRFDDVRRELAFGLPFCSERKALDQQAMDAISLLRSALEHRGRLETDKVRAVAYQLDCSHRAPLRAPVLDPFADFQL